MFVGLYYYSYLYRQYNNRIPQKGDNNTYTIIWNRQNLHLDNRKA